MLLDILSQIDIPPISPDFNAPFQTGIQVIVSYILGAAIIAVLGALIIAIASLAFAGVAPERMSTWAGKNVVTILIAAVVLGSVGGIFQFAVNFNFGF